MSIIVLRYLKRRIPCRCTEDALAIHVAFKKVGFNALYASLEDCLPFEFDDILLDVKNDDSSEAVARKKPTKFESETVKDLSRMFDEFSANDSFTGCLDRMGEECLPSYERFVFHWSECRESRVRFLRGNARDGARSRNFAS